MARPPKPIDLKLVEDLARIHCTETEIASVLGFTPEGFRKRKRRQPALVGVIEKGREAGRMSLRRLQWQSASKGNVVMQIWLGKQLLAQREPRHEVEVSSGQQLGRIAALEAALAGEIGVGGSAGGPGIDDGEDAKAETDGTE
jgi:hypothetical protein